LDDEGQGRGRGRGPLTEDDERAAALGDGTGWVCKEVSDVRQLGTIDMPLCGWLQREVDGGLERNGEICDSGCSISGSGGSVYDRCAVRPVVLVVDDTSGGNGVHSCGV